MRKYIKLALFFLFFVTLVSNSFAASSTWTIDPAHTGFYFGVNHIYSEVKGFFDKYDGTILFDPNDLNASRFEFTVYIDSVNTNNRKRDSHLRSGDFFDSKNFPEMTFKSTSISHTQNNKYSVKGILTIKDVSKEVEIPFTYFGFKQHPANPKQDVAGFDARMTINRLSYNVGNGKFHQMGVVDDTVDILITIEASRDR
jgi:polyisoprenoid-binding protein YceI